MEGPDLIATLIPSDDDDLARNAFRHEDNQKRCLPPTRGIDEGPATSSREATPACAQSIVDDYGTHEHKHRLRLTFNKEPPKDPTKGYAFGTDKQKCDVLLGSRGARGTSRVHFHITFDLIGGKRRLVLTDCSTHGTAVIYNGQAREEVRHHFTWILNLEKGEGEWKIVVHVRRLKFKVELASHETYKAEYNENVEKFLNHSRTADPPLGVLSINSYLPTVIPSQSLTPGQRPIYIHEEELGRGSFGRVDRVVNVSTGAIYAHKEFYEPKWEKDAERRKHQQEKWRNQIRREIRIMMEHPHEHIIPIVDFQEEPRPFFVMPYLPLGSLDHVNRENPLAVEDIIDLLIQALDVLGYLHSRGVAYRDLKPENILVEYRSPLHLRFADFGLANDQPDLETFCGTERYSAPEVYMGERYTTAVDLWSLGVIVLEYVYGLPTRPPQAGERRENTREQGLAWCRRLVDHVNDWDWDPWIDLLTTGMLRMEPRERLPAGACWTKACGLGLFNDPSVGSGSATPTRPTALGGGARNEEGSPTIIMDALWGAGEESLNHDGDVHAGRRFSDHHSVISTSRQLGTPKPLSNEDAHRLRKGTSGHAPDRSSGHVRMSLELRCPLEAGSMYPGSKRHRSPAVASPGHHSDESRIKRRPPGVRLTKIRAPQASKIPSALDNVGKVMKADTKHLQMMIDGQVVLMREDDCTINATQILKLSGKNQWQEKHVLKTLKEREKVVFRPARGTHGPENTWVSIRCGKDLCVELGLAEKLQPLLEHGLVLQLNRSNTGSRKSLVGRKPMLRDFANEPEALPFIEVINGLRPVMVRRSDWRINATHIANQAESRQMTTKLRQGLPIDVYDIGRGSSKPRQMTTKLRQELPIDAYDIVRGSIKHQGTYVDFDIGIEWCRRLGLSDLVDQLLQLKRVANEPAAAVQQDHIASPVLENPPNPPHAISVSSRLANSNHVRAPAKAGRSCSEESPEPGYSVVTGYPRTSKTGVSLEEEDSSVDIDVTQLHAPGPSEFDHKVPSQHSNDDTETDHPQCVEGKSLRKKTSYYSDRDFEPQNSELREVKLGLHTPSKTSSRYGSASDFSRLFLVAASDGRDTHPRCGSMLMVPACTINRYDDK